ncbi:MAG: pyrroloquinoline quinone biosynthesis protein PqqB [Silvibacterium sp.]|nr:pyrroloquinoline quinone biosynthesis protein PqqB [Silvibacterium sp.]
MLIRVLGTAAGGGFPQWNCSCGNCRRVREGTFAGRPRSQNQLAVSANGLVWFLINASPDLRYQIESFFPLYPRPTSPRDSPIQGVVLTSAELDVCLGLLLLRESQPLTVYATESVIRILLEDNSFCGVLRRLPDQVRWRPIALDEPFCLETIRGMPSGMRCTPIAAAGNFPGYVTAERASQLVVSQASIGLFIEHGEKKLAFIPGSPLVADSWLSELENCDALFFDGTFWSDDELIRVQGTTKTARQMGHLPVGGPDGSLKRFSGLKGPRKIFIHINNTNPMLDEGSDEHRQVIAAGWELAHDGMDLGI